MSPDEVASRVTGPHLSLLTLSLRRPAPADGVACSRGAGGREGGEGVEKEWNGVEMEARDGGEAGVRKKGGEKDSLFSVTVRRYFRVVTGSGDGEGGG